MSTTAPATTATATSALTIVSGVGRPPRTHGPSSSSGLRRLFPVRGPAGGSEVRLPLPTSLDRLRDCSRRSSGVARGHGVAAEVRLSVVRGRIGCGLGPVPVSRSSSMPRPGGGAPKGGCGPDELRSASYGFDELARES
ncbi:hypothetical protein [Nonomuraea salmonea]|uniref:hypothetical protein n=1 Tax=Nonomuraea salmonea TaxID=46181 RepID=UPI002FED68A9